MATMARCCFLLVILGASVRVESLWNFRAKGEYLTADNIADCDSGVSFDSQRYFEEVHYSEGTEINKTALRIDPEGVDASSFFGDFAESKVFWQMGSECEKVTSNDPVIPDFKSWSFGSEAVYAPIFTTLNELRYRIANESLFEAYERGLPAVKVEVNLKNGSDQKHYIEKAYVTFEQLGDESEYDFTNLIPLSVEVCFVNDGKRSKERLSIMEFAWNTTVEQDASPAAGIQCAEYGRTVPSNLFNMSTLVLRMEQVIDGNVMTSDVAVDFGRQLLRISDSVFDYFVSTKQREENGGISTSQVVYKIANPDSRSQSCGILQPADMGKLPWTFVDFTVKGVKDFFAVSDKFMIKTKTKRRGIVCDLISGLRTDYLPERMLPSVWEWCIGDVKTAEGIQSYMVHLDIFLQNQEDGSIYQESYSLYDVERDVDPKRLYVEYFTGLEPCFKLDRKMNLQVTVDSADASGTYSVDAIETAIESGTFKAEVLDKLLSISRLRPDSYRFASPQALIFDNADAVFQFYLLDGPEGSPANQSMKAIREQLQAEISKAALPVDVGDLKFSIRKNSLVDAEEVVLPTPPPPPTPETPATAATLPTDATLPSRPTPPHPVTPKTPAIPTTDTPIITTTEEISGLPEVPRGSRGALVFGVAFAVLLVGGGVGVLAGNRFLKKE